MDVRSLLGFAGLEPEGAVQWGESVGSREAGVYLVSLSGDPGHAYGLSEAPLSADAITALLEARRELCVDGHPATVESLRDRLASMWVPDQPVLYIGRATSLRSRINQYYATPLGARSPHAGGWPLKTLGRLDELWVHWAETPDFRTVESTLLAEFVGGVRGSFAARLIDPEAPLPFANLVGGDGRRQRHGISGARAPRV